MIDLLQSNNPRISREELLDLAKDSKSTINAAMQTLNDLLLFDKIESNMLQLECQWTPCKGFLQDCIRPFIRQLGLSRVHLSIVLEDKLEVALCYVDQHKLEQVIRNFIGNAVKFTPQSGGQIEIEAKLIDGRIFVSHQCGNGQRVRGDSICDEGQTIRGERDGEGEEEANFDDEIEERYGEGEDVDDPIDERDDRGYEREGLLDRGRGRSRSIGGRNRRQTSTDTATDTSGDSNSVSSQSSSSRSRSRSVMRPMEERTFLRFEVRDNGAGISLVSHSM